MRKKKKKLKKKLAEKQGNDDDDDLNKSNIPTEEGDRGNYSKRKYQ